ncbi:MULTISPECIES: hypothetical protein [unclassified Methanoregula]|uniref:hypothetical protein n=1 Tax=unclassified Methanoregula TaxID=2649730 RepID=UPI0009CD1319|nr:MULTISPECIES: hypothetical protein [unclassified Methanoregula]OPX63719.1 MAG: hypothetical protein A4E33_01534 [Methanoregula sp. PtaB.Bin085]OPY37264.1 MAG: hypothetical protein A4E34_00058 [Methanoregula sp. PtaU1.Bin006]
MDTFRGIQKKYLTATCLVLTFLLFTAGGIAFNQSPFYGAVFFIIAILLFFVGAYFGNSLAGDE